MLIAPALPGAQPLSALAGLLAIAGGGALAIGGALDLGTNLTPWPKPVKASELATGGVYALCRHPIYGGLVIACVGLGLLSGSCERLLLSGALYALLTQKARREEAMLVEKHGAQYEAWAARVPAFFPAPERALALLRGGGE